MKKMTIIFALISTISHAQFAENFESLTLKEKPFNWFISRGENNNGDDFDNWKIINMKTNQSFTNCMFVRYENSGQINEDWLVTPLISLKDYNNVFLHFNQMHSFNGNTTEYQIRVSNNSQTEKKSFRIINSYDDTTFSNNFTSKKIDLSSFDGEEIYIAFVKIQDNGDDWIIDDINVVGSRNDNLLKNFKLFPNPSSDLIYIESDLKVKYFSIFNYSGIELIKVDNKQHIDISSLKSGIYFIDIVFENNLNLKHKIIKI